MNHHRTTWFDGTAGRRVLVEHLVSNLAFGQTRSVAFVVPSDVSWTLPFYDVAITTARRGWKIAIDEVRYWLVTPEPEPLARLGTAVSAVASQRLEPEGIAFIGSTYPDVRDGLVLLDPQGESIEVDLVVALGCSGGFDVTSDRRRFGRRRRACTVLAETEPQPQGTPCTLCHPPQRAFASVAEQTRGCRHLRHPQLVHSWHQLDRLAGLRSPRHAGG
jgi:hypothetical protein